MNAGSVTGMDLESVASVALFRQGVMTNADQLWNLMPVVTVVGLLLGNAHAERFAVVMESVIPARFPAVTAFAVPVPWWMSAMSVVETAPENADVMT